MRFAREVLRFIGSGVVEPPRCSGLYVALYKRLGVLVFRMVWGRLKRLAARVKPGLYPWSTWGFCPRRGMQERLAAFASLIRWSAPVRSTFSGSVTG